jgi:hypothetical protein
MVANLRKLRLGGICASVVHEKRNAYALGFVLVFGFANVQAAELNYYKILGDALGGCIRVNWRTCGRAYGFVYVL